MHYNLYLISLLCLHLGNAQSNISTSGADWVSLTMETLPEPSYDIARSKFFYSRMIHKKQNVPDYFDARNKWPKCKSISKIYDQYGCGTCWAFAVATMMSDRYCIASKEKEQFEFSIQEIITCCSRCYSRRVQNKGRCHMDVNPVDGIVFLQQQGAPSQLCKPYDVLSANASGCKNFCTNLFYTKPYHKDKRRPENLLRENSRFHNFNLTNIQIEIMTNGPVITYLQVDDHFRYYAGYKYRTDVYRAYSKPSVKRRAHIVRVIGWGTQRGTPYWLVANSWGAEWGDRGFFKIVRGRNELSCETYFTAGDFKKRRRPKITSSSQALEKSFFIIVIVVMTMYALMRYGVM